ncbi:hypothetical protein GCM10010912_68400 [Paenibacillus albidus]|uniref:Uncharacterized protein n=1 Tax=Paenibacillus albidus TaxID=2041023 RepID=A0A917FYK0_9BACL|nr:hypothetical protein GCM10010912_68400 [Paenibacillus albidus]
MKTLLGVLVMNGIAHNQKVTFGSTNTLTSVKPSCLALDTYPPKYIGIPFNKVS